MTSSLSIAVRAALAVALMIGFYLLALAIICVLLYVVYVNVDLTHEQEVNFKLVAFCIVTILAILWAVLPRSDKFEPPGPLLTPAKHPRLFGEIEVIAKSVGQAIPVEVYLLKDVNAWVSQRGGIMGFGGRRVMGVGLPLLRVLTRSQFRAVLAHEFGHFHAGDTRLGPWVYKTRGAIGRTLEALNIPSREAGVFLALFMAFVRLPFLGYGRMFLRITLAVSRRQEFLADDLAARTAGAKPLADGLRMVDCAAFAFQGYWINEYVPVLNAGFRPPLVEGFNRFLACDAVAEAVNRHLDEELQAGQSNPYDTHPPLKERLAAVINLPAGEARADDTPALTLLEDVPLLEQQLLGALAGTEAAASLKPVDWNAVCSQVYLPQWKQLVKANAAGLKDLTPASLPKWSSDPKLLGRRFQQMSGAKVDDEYADGLAQAVIGSALAVLALERGGRLESVLGKPIVASLGPAEIKPFEVLKALNSGELPPEQWQSLCINMGMQEADLGKIQGV